MIRIKKRILPLIVLILVILMSAACLAATYTYYQDADEDGYGNSSIDIENDTAPPGYVTVSGDCDDDDDSIHPGATEACDSIDNDCDGQTDEGALTTYYKDSDGDEYGNTSLTQQACSKPSGYAPDDGDCNDTEDSINPGVTEICDGIDNDCDGKVDEKLSAPLNSLQNGVCAESLKKCKGSDGWANDYSKLADYEETETSCDTFDNDCDGQADEGLSATYYRDSDGDGVGSTSGSRQACSKPSGYVTASGDCNDDKASINPGATEVCDEMDNDCDGSVDEGVLTTYYSDSDNDTYGYDASKNACSLPSGYVLNNNDCNDTIANIHPNATETCGNGIDENCDDADDPCPILGGVVGVLKKPAGIAVVSVLGLAAVIAVIAFFVNRKKKVSFYP